MENINILLAVSLGLQAYIIYQQREGFKLMGKALDAVAVVEEKVQKLGGAIVREIVQLKDAIAAGNDTEEIVTRLSAVGDSLATFTADLDADDSTDGEPV